MSNEEDEVQIVGDKVRETIVMQSIKCVDDSWDKNYVK
jgi:hypothetical protein